MKKNQKSIGSQIRKIRKSKKITIEDIASRTGFTSSFISQFERDLTTASIASLQKITAELDINISSLFIINEIEENKFEYKQEPELIRKSGREKIIHSAPLKTIDYFLNKQGKTEVIYSEVEVGGSSREAYLHNSNEKIVTVLQGQMRLIIDKKEYLLCKGDTITFSSQSFHEWENTGIEVLELIWIISHHSSNWTI